MMTSIRRTSPPNAFVVASKKIAKHVIAAEEETRIGGSYPAKDAHNKSLKPLSYQARRADARSFG